MNLVNNGVLGEFDGTSLPPFEVISYDDPEKEYSRKNYRFKVTKGQGSPIKAWSMSTLDHTLGPYLFPQFGRSNPLTTARVLVFADLDISVAS